MVVFAMAASQRAAHVTPARMRIPSYAVWEFAVFVLNVLAFILVGLPAQGDRRAGSTRATLVRYIGVAAAVCVATILARIVWVSGAAAVSRWRARPAADGAPRTASDAALSVARGRRRRLVRHARHRDARGGARRCRTASDGGPAFPYRDLVLFTAFAVVLGTLVVQGLTLRPLMNALRLEDDGSVEREVRLARVETLRAALSATADCPARRWRTLLRRRYEVMLQRAEAQLAGDGEPATAVARAGARASEADAAIVRRATAAERQRLLALRADGTIGDAAFQRIEQELDLEELDLQQLAGREDQPGSG